MNENFFGGKPVSFLDKMKSSIVTGERLLGRVLSYEKKSDDDNEADIFGQVIAPILDQVKLTLGEIQTIFSFIENQPNSELEAKKLSIEEILEQLERKKKMLVKEVEGLNQKREISNSLSLEELAYNDESFIDWREEKYFYNFCEDKLYVGNEHGWDEKEFARYIREKGDLLQNDYKEYFLDLSSQVTVLEQTIKDLEAFKVTNKNQQGERSSEIFNLEKNYEGCLKENVELKSKLELLENRIDLELSKHEEIIEDNKKLARELSRLLTEEKLNTKAWEFIERSNPDLRSKLMERSRKSLSRD